MNHLFELLEPSLGAALALLVAGLLAATLACLPPLAIGGFSTYIERKVAADMQRRLGPVWPLTDPIARYFGTSALGKLLLALAKVPVLGWPLRAPGLFQFLVDGVKLVIKEDLVPRGADRVLYKLAPYLVLCASFAVFAVMPYSRDLQAVDLPLGVFYVIAISSGMVLGILMGGWGSNNKWSLLGGFRSAAQVISFEIPVGLCILTIVLYSGSMGMQGLVAFQEPPSWLSERAGSWIGELSFLGWNLFGLSGSESWRGASMFLVMAPLSLVYFVATLAECNRTPFDIPEAESELVGGYHTEYSGMRFAFFFLAEYAEMIAVSALAVVLFLGGYRLPVCDHLLLNPVDGLLAGSGVLVNLVQVLCFLAKLYVLVLVQMWVRWTLPRFRVDQMMALCWKKLIPLAFGAFCLTAWGMLG